MGQSRGELAEAAGVPIGNVHPVEPGLHMEILDTRTMRVWQTMANVTRQEFEALEVDDPYRKVGVGALASYCSFFRRSPGAPSDGPMQTLELGGHQWSLCANAGEASLPYGPNGPRLLSVNKHHSIVYAEGSELCFLESPEGEAYVQVVGTGRDVLRLEIPAGWSLDSVRLDQQTIVDLPCPTSALFFPTAEGIESFQGPVSRPQR